MYKYRVLNDILLNSNLISIDYLKSVLKTPKAMLLLKLSHSVSEINLLLE